MIPSAARTAGCKNHTFSAAQYCLDILFGTHPQPFPTSREGSYGLQGLIFFCFYSWIVGNVLLIFLISTFCLKKHFCYLAVYFWFRLLLRSKIAIETCSSNDSMRCTHRRLREPDRFCSAILPGYFIWDPSPTLPYEQGPVPSIREGSYGLQGLNFFG